MKMFNTLRIVPTQNGYLVIQEPAHDLLLTPADVVHHIDKYDLGWRLQDILNNQPEEDNNATE